MEDEIEATQRQLRRSAALIQDAFEGLSTLHNRVAQVSAMREGAQGRTSPPSVPRAPMPRHITNAGPVRPENTGRRTMDPGHDVIVISSSETDPIPPTSTSPPRPPMSAISATAPRSFDSTTESLDALRTELFASTQSFRERAGELEELRRSIAQFTQERNAAWAEGMSTSAARTVPRGQESDPFAGLSPGLSRRAMLEYNMRQRAASESATSLGLMVAARASASPSNPHDISRRDLTRPFPAVSPDTPTAPNTHNSPPGTASHIPPGIASRVTRISQEIQQDIARIAHQSELLMGWISDNRARLDAAAVSRASTRSSNEITESSFTRTSDIAFAPSIPTRPDTTTPTQRRRTSEIETLPVERRDGGRSVPQPAVVIPRRTSDAAVRARYLRRPVPSSWTTGSPVASDSHEEGAPSPSWRMRQQGQDGPLSLPSRTLIPQVTGTTARRNDDGSTSDDAELNYIETMSRARLSIEGLRALRRDQEEWNEMSSRVRRRYTVDGDEEVVRVALRPELSPGFGEASEPAREETDGAEDEEEGTWAQALSRLDALSRETAAREAVRSRWDMQESLPRRASRGVSTATADAGTSFVTRRNSRVWPRLSPRGEEGSTEDDEYERDIAAMRARARSLINSTAPPRSVGGAPLPPPPPTTRPLAFVPTTQGTPGSLWNDSNVRVRIRAAAAHFDENIRRALDHPYFTGISAAARATLAAGGTGAAPERSSHSYGSASQGLRGAARARTAGKGAETVKEQAVWGSPTPFCPSALPLPSVDDVSGLQARSLAFGGAKRFAHQPRRRVLAEAGR